MVATRGPNRGEARGAEPEEVAMELESFATAQADGVDALSDEDYAKLSRDSGVVGNVDVCSPSKILDWENIGLGNEGS